MAKWLCSRRAQDVWCQILFLFHNLLLSAQQEGFLALTGAQDVTMSVCPAQVCKENSIFIFLAPRALTMLSEGNLTVLYRRSHKYFVLFYY